MKAIILDIEGTTTDIEFVHKVLFPYSQKRFPSYLKEKQNDPVVSGIIHNIRENFLNEKAQLDEVISLINSWIENDQKIPELKELQGLIWEDGYKEKEYVGHLYPDVVLKLTEWKELGLKLYIYSSGSVKAQKLLFAHTNAGDITSFFNGYFDTKIGGKKESKSYQNILNDLGMSGSDVLFLSDNEDELNAAYQLGIHTFHLNRDGLYTKSAHRIIDTFSEVTFE